eukprot:2786922-Amphidinium_carterae.1
MPVVEPDPPLVLPAEMLPKALYEDGPCKRVVEYNEFVRCLVCFRQTGKVKGKFNYSYLKRKECRPFRKHFKHH